MLCILYDKISEIPPVEDFVGNWQSKGSSLTKEIVCSRVSDNSLQCLLPRSNGGLKAREITMNGLRVTISNPTKTGSYAGNGVIIWDDGNTWSKKGTCVEFVSSKISVQKKT